MDAIPKYMIAQAVISPNVEFVAKFLMKWSHRHSNNPLALLTD